MNVGEWYFMLFQVAAGGLFKVWNQLLVLQMVWTGMDLVDTMEVCI